MSHTVSIETFETIELTPAQLQQIADAKEDEAQLSIVERMVEIETRMQTCEQYDDYDGYVMLHERYIKLAEELNAIR